MLVGPALVAEYFATTIGPHAGTKTALTLLLDMTYAMVFHILLHLPQQLVSKPVSKR
jgi:hypothetical protein